MTKKRFSLLSPGTHSRGAGKYSSFGKVKQKSAPKKSAPKKSKPTFGKRKGL